MKSPIRVRMTEVLTMLVVIIAVIALAERTAWQQIRRLRDDLRPALVGHFHSADRVRSAILEAHEAWTASAAMLGKGDVTKFQSAAEQAEMSFRQEQAAAAISGQADVLSELTREFAKYRELAWRFLTLERGQASTDAAVLEAQIQSQFLRMMLICQKHSEADDAMRQKVLERAGAALGRLQVFLLVCAVSLVLCGGVVAALTYRRVIGPLHTTLAETRTIMERHEKLASLGVFATGIAHEIRNPITAIKVRLFTLRASHQPGSSESEDLEVIESEINRLERIVQEFLRFARPAEPEFQVVPVDRFLREVHQLVLPELSKRGIALKLELSARTPVRIDPEKMKQVLINFIQNAADSIEGEGTVTLSSMDDRVSIDDRALSAVVIGVSDTGKGIPPEVEKRLFDPFFTTKEKGTGLGLPIAARIIEKHGGLIRYQTQVNRGTTFSILLPRTSL